MLRPVCHFVPGDVVCLETLCPDQSRPFMACLAIAGVYGGTVFVVETGRPSTVSGPGDLAMMPQFRVPLSFDVLCRV